MRTLEGNDGRGDIPQGYCKLCGIATFNMADQNVEYQSLVQYTSDLTQLIQHNVVSLSSDFFAKGLVAKDVHDSVLSVDGASNQSKAAKLLSCVIDKIRDSCGRFQDFIDVLVKDPYFDDIVLKITKAHSKMIPIGYIYYS